VTYKGRRERCDEGNESEEGGSELHVWFLELEEIGTEEKTKDDLTQGAKRGALAITATVWHPTRTCMALAWHLTRTCTALAWDLHGNPTAFATDGTCLKF
jgi:hypothetical protein